MKQISVRARIKKKEKKMQQFVPESAGSPNATALSLSPTATERASLSSSKAMAVVGYTNESQ
jgi:hypothetical protein